METHPHLDLDAVGPVVGEEGLLTLDRGEKRIACARKSDEEGVALSVDLVAPMGHERSTKEAPMIGENLRIALAQLLDEPCRPLDVGEEERDGARSESRPCGASVDCHRAKGKRQPQARGGFRVSGYRRS